MRADRVCGELSDQLFILAETNMENISAVCQTLSPAFLIIDSIQTMYTADLESAPGSVSQVRACGNELMRIGKSFGIRTVYSSLLMSFLLRGLEIVIPLSAPLTSQPLMELLFAVGLPAVGSAILFNLDASSGGTDIVAMILKKYTSLNIGIALLCSDILITLGACVAFGMETGLFSVLGLIIKSLFIDVVVDNLRIQKCFFIITSNPDPIERYITATLHRGATELHGEGAFTHQGKSILLTAMSRQEAVRLRLFIRQNDPHAFLIITSSSEIIGKGFRGVN